MTVVAAVNVQVVMDAVKMPKYRVNRKLVDIWTFIHLIAGFFLAMILTILFRDLAFAVVVATILSILWEVSEYVIKRNYDVFNKPFGRKPELESLDNIGMDLIFSEIGIVLLVFCLFW